MALRGWLACPNVSQSRTPESCRATGVISICMNLDHESLSPSIDAKSAEQALQIAVRLQQEGGQRVSLEELDKTAEEAGIDPAYVREALRRLQQQGQAQQSDTQKYRARLGRLFAGMMAGLVAALVVILARSPDWNNASAHVALVAAAAAAMAAAIVATKTRAFVRRRREGASGIERQR